MKVLLLPADGRPFHTQMPRALASIAGHELMIPPAALLGRGADSADSNGVFEFIESHAPLADAIVISVDLVVHGGIEASRNAKLTFAQARERLDRLAQIIHPHAARTTLFSSITAGTTSITSETDAVIAGQISKLNSFRGRTLSNREAALRDELIQTIPRETLDDYESARVRNHEIQLQLIALMDRGVASRIVFLQNDSGEHGAHVSEEQQLRERSRNRNIQFLTAREEAGVVLAAAAILDDDPQVFKVSVVLSDAPGMGRKALYESSPFRENFHLYMRQLGFIVDHGAPDIELYLHPPVPKSCDLFQNPQPERSLDVTQFVDLLRMSVAARNYAILIDCGHTNGGDPHLMNQISKVTISGLSGYSASGTASASVGTGLAQAAMIALGNKTGKLNIEECTRLVWLQILDNYIFKTLARPEIQNRCIRDRIDRYQFGRNAADLDSILNTRMHELAADLLPFGVPAFRARFPWNRLLECEIDWC
ncbi:MAG: DUF4127 family protein [Planctomycetota bacterium]